MAQYDDTVRRGAEEVARRVNEAKVRFASVDDVLDQAEEWTDEQVTCRIRNHRFTVPITAVHNTRYKYFFIVLGCAGGCGVQLHQEMNEGGRIDWQKMYYGEAKGYLSNSGRVIGEAKDALRREWLNRVIKPAKTTKNEPGRGDYS